jgi:hypothetical protein
MPFVLIIIGTVLLISSVRNTYGATTPTGGPGLAKLVQGDFTGQANFLYWIIALLLIGAVGYVRSLRPISVAFLALIIIVLFLKKGNPSGVGGGFFSQFTAALGTTQQSAPQSVTTTLQQLYPSSPLGSLIPSYAPTVTF